MRFMRLRPVRGGRRWYTNFRYKGQKIEISLDAWEHQERLATIRLGEVFKDLENGIHPRAANKMIKSFPVPVFKNRDHESSLRNHLLPFFGRRFLREIDEDCMAEYLDWRWGRDENGELRAVKTTLDREMLVLKRWVQLTVKTWTPPRVKFRRIKKPKKHPLTPEQVNLVGSFISAKIRPIYWVLAHTGMDIGDVLALTPAMIQNGWITKKRGKTSQDIRLPVTDSLLAVFQEVPWPIDPDQKIFHRTSDYITVACKRAFVKAGLPDYSAKDLRRYVASRMLDAGYEMDWIAKALGHAPGSQLTKVYPAIYDTTLEEAFQKIERRVGE